MCVNNRRRKGGEGGVTEGYKKAFNPNDDCIGFSSRFNGWRSPISPDKFNGIYECVKCILWCCIPFEILMPGYSISMHLNRLIYATAKIITPSNILRMKKYAGGTQRPPPGIAQIQYDDTHSMVAILPSQPKKKGETMTESGLHSTTLQNQLRNNNEPHQKTSQCNWNAERFICTECTECRPSTPNPKININEMAYVLCVYVIHTHESCYFLFVPSSTG